jgi:hypothetical protein
MPINYEISTPAPSLVFAIYIREDEKKVLLPLIRHQIDEAIRPFSINYRLNEDASILEIWKCGKWMDVQDALKKQFPQAVIQLLAN